MKVRPFKSFIDLYFLFFNENDLDFDRMIPPLVEKNRPAYYFVRLDTISEISGHNWLLIVYIPDEAKV